MISNQGIRQPAQNSRREATWRRLGTLAHTLLLILIIWFSSSTVVQANAPPPPTLTWFEITGMPEDVTAMQIVGCGTQHCPTPSLLAYSGRCTANGCLHHPATPDRSFACHDSKCLHIDGFTENIEPLPSGQPSPQPLAWFRVAVQSSDRLWSSPTIPMPSFAVGRQYTWQVKPTGTAGLTLTAITPSPDDHRLIRGILLTLVTEAIVLGLGLWRFGVERAVWSRSSVSFGLMHTVSYPLVWNLTIGLAPFHYVGHQILAVMAIAIALLYALCLYPIRHAQSWKLLRLSLVLLPIGLFVGLFFTFLFSYGQFEPSLQGLPYPMAVAIAEVVVTLYEAGFLALLSRGQLSLKRSIGLSVIMNAASLSVGMWWLP